jgi:hypothetical protein
MLVFGFAGLVDLMCAGGVNLPCCSTHEQGWLCGGDTVMMMWSQLWWCSWCDAVGGVALGRLVFLAEEFHLLWCFYTGLCYLGAWHLSPCIWWVSCCGLACPAQLAWDIFLDALVISFKYLMIIYSGIVFDCHLLIPPFGYFFVYSLLAGSKRKRRRKERKKMCSFRNNYLYIFCSLL